MIGERPFPKQLSDYYCDDVPVFPYNRSKVNRQAHPQGENNDNFLRKGPKYHLPYDFDKQFWNKVDEDFESYFYKLRWKINIENEENSNDRSDHKKIPFDRNSCKLPNKLSDREEFKLKQFFFESKQIMHEESKKLEKNPQYVTNLKASKNLKNELEKNEQECLRTDKTNRLIVCDSKTVKDKMNEILADKETYVNLSKSKCKAIEVQANKILKAALRKSTLAEHGYQKDRLLSCGSKPADFFGFVKDHKEPTNGAYPMRPIASVHGTPVDKVDWCIAQVLTQLLRFIPAHLDSSEALISQVKDMDITDMQKPVFMSLDVEKLYPSIPISKGIEYNITTISSHYEEIDNFKIEISDLENMLRFLCYNYEISYDGRIYRQVKGVPMGCRFAPAFAIIFLHHVETKALQSLTFVPKVYKRYIDDVIIGPIENDETVIEEVKKHFNEVLPEIKFTVEVNPPEIGLNFLDLTLLTGNHKIEYKWYHKECHSDIVLQKDSFIANHVKTNFIKSRLDYIKHHCSGEKSFNESREEFFKILKYNGYKEKDFNKKYKKRRNKKEKRENKANLMIPFINDACHRRIKKVMNKYNVPGNLISKPNVSLEKFFRNKPKMTKDCGCEICKEVGPKYSCEDRYVVYQYTCKTCNEKYIGKTARPFKIRHQEHKSSIKNNTSNSALAQHRSKHSINGIQGFKIQFLSKKSNTRDTTIEESKHIRNHKPEINRKHEINNYPLIASTT